MKRLGDFYSEKVLILPKKLLIKKELPSNSGEIRIERDLFGWKLYCGKNFVECRSEEEARYLRVFLETGLREVYVPRDEEYLKNILPELERLKAKTDEIINFHIEGILNPKIREKVKREVYAEITKVREESES
jgi:hypothetical protein